MAAACASQVALPRTTKQVARCSAFTTSQRAVRRSEHLVARAAEAAAPSLVDLEVRIKLKAFEVPLLEEFTDQIRSAVESTGAKMSGPVRLPTRRKIFCVLRSPHVNKDSREHFEIRTHSRLMDIKNLTPETIEALQHLDAPSGVDSKVTVRQ